MYKTKLTQWKFFKNNRQSDVANLLYLQQHRLAMGKESTFRRNGRTVDVSAYIRRKGLRPVDLLEAAQSGDLPPTLRCGTPPPPPSPPRLPKQIQAPDDFLLQEAYLFWSLDNPFVPPPLDRNFSRQLDIYHKSDAVRSVALLTHGCWLLSIGKIQEGGGFCRRAFASVDSVLRGAAHFAVYELMEVIRRYPDPGIHRALWNYLAAYAARTNGLNPNLKRVLAAIANLAGNSDMDHSLLMFQWARRIPSMQSNGTFDGKPFDYTFIQPWDMLPMDRSYNHRYYMNQGLWTVENIPTATMPNLEEVGDPWNLRADLLVVFGNQTAWADDRIPALALKMLDQVPEDRPHGYLHFVCLYALAQNNRARCRDGKAQFDCDHKLARNYLRQAADVQSQAWQPGKNYYETLTLLEAWHLEAGDKEEAEATRTKRDVECQKAFENLHL
ncbi:putative Clr5 domain protein [Rosellinia necatrix]|uniref:Putative Clr5 domain protein n=1 Tax=Rosellinia necatrix TaxID=77044 RepID=A0A1S8AA20_ROSNE|nr:putative Clr5 domain protein [Rosellinia necatrix]